MNDAIAMPPLSVNPDVVRFGLVYSDSMALRVLKGYEKRDQRLWATP